MCSEFFCSPKFKRHLEFGKQSFCFRLFKRPKSVFLGPSDKYSSHLEFVDFGFFFSVGCFSGFCFSFWGLVFFFFGCFVGLLVFLAS